MTRQVLSQQYQSERSGKQAHDHLGLNDVFDWLRLKAGVLARFGVTPPSRNTLSNANKECRAENDLANSPELREFFRASH